MCADKVFELFNKYGNNDYIGEPITQTQHMIQAAMIAEQFIVTDEFKKIGDAGSATQFIVACLLHDIGHLLFEKHELMGNLGVKSHEDVGADYLQSIGFDCVVVELVRNHVNSKRYLCAIDPEYFNKLSQASVQTLAYQGGIMSKAEQIAFENSPLFLLFLQMRCIDEQAKETNVTYNTLEYYREMINKVTTAYDQYR